jgi:hypothetical protein
LIQTPDYCRTQAAQIGPATSQVVERLLSDRPLDRLRAVQALLRLEEQVGTQRLEAACARAIFFGDVRYRRIKEILKAGLDREPLPQPEPQQTEQTQPFIFARSSSDFFPPQPEVRPC